MLQDLKRFVWSSGKDPDGIFNSDAKAASLANLEPPDFGNKAWTYEGKEKLLKSSKNTGKYYVTKITLTKHKITLSGCLIINTNV